MDLTRVNHSNPSSGISIGLGMLEICERFFSYGLRPPCIQIIFSLIIAATGMTLKTSEKSFHSFKLYFLCINHKTHTFY